MRRSILLGAAISPLFAAPLRADTIATYLMDEADGVQTLNDSSGGDDNGYLGSTSSADAQDPARQNDSPFRNGRSLLFGATPAQAATLVPDTANQFNFGASPFTAELWIKPTSISTPAVQRFLSYGDNWVFRSDSSKLRGYFNSATAGDAQGVAQLRNNVWQHVAMRYTGSAGGNKIQLYVNGDLDKEVTASGSPNAAGSPNVTISTSGSENYRGGMDEVRISSGALAPASFGTYQTLSSSPANPTPLNYTGGSYTLVPNGGFETAAGAAGSAGDAASWNGEGNGSVFFRSIDSPAQGTHVLAVSERTTQVAAPSVTVTGLQVNQQYVLSAYILRAGNGNARLDLGDAPEDTAVPGFEAALVADNTGQYDFVHATFTAQATSRTVRAIIDGAADPSSAPGRYYFDDIAVTLASDFVAPTFVPEPGAAAALAVGGLGLLARRRR